MKKKKSLAELLFGDVKLNLIKEEEEDDGGDDIFGDDDDSGDDDAEEESDDDEGGDDEGGDDEADEEEAEDDDADDEEDDSDDDDEDEPLGPADDTIDGEVNNLLADFEAEAIASAEQSESLKGESHLRNMHKNKVSKLLFEADEPVFDVVHFANNIARVIDNYQALLDVEKSIFDKAYSYLAAKYGESVATDFENTLESEHQLSFVTGVGDDSSKTSDEIVPVAAGAMNPVG